MIGDDVIPMAPGAFLAECHLPGRKLSPEQAAAAMGVSIRTLDDLIAGRSGVTTDLAERLSVFSGLSVPFWRNLQAAYDRACRPCGGAV